ncbi:hypothetical protein Hanom_Chr13g01198191 [Helianthus anomalus]
MNKQTLSVSTSRIITAITSSLLGSSSSDKASLSSSISIYPLLFRSKNAKASLR